MVLTLSTLIDQCSLVVHWHFPHSQSQHSSLTCAVQCSAVQCSAVQCSAVQCSAVRCSAVQCSAVQCSAVQCSAVQCSAVQYSAVQNISLKLRAVLNSVKCSCVNCAVKAVKVGRGQLACARGSNISSGSFQENILNRKKKTLQNK